jgi:hypothetical protein
MQLRSSPKSPPQAKVTIRIPRSANLACSAEAQLLVRRASNHSRCQRIVNFTGSLDSPLEGTGFELSVPRCKRWTFLSSPQNLRLYRAQAADDPPVSPALRPGRSRAIFLWSLRRASSTSIGGSTLCWRFATVQPIRALAKNMANLTRASSSWRPSDGKAVCRA